MRDRPGAGDDAGKYQLIDLETGCGLCRVWGVYPPLPCWSGPVTWGLYRGRGTPLPVDVPRRVASGGAEHREW
jgi:hypothetical protein